MAMGEAEYRAKAESLQARLNTLEQNVGPLKERIQRFKENFGVRERSDGSIEIDFEKMVDRLGLEACLELRQVIDERYKISGEAGEKPKVRVTAGA